MKTINVIHVDDDRNQLEHFAEIVADIKEIKLVGSFTNTDLAISYLNKHKVGIIFLDIEMQPVDGIKFSKMIIKFKIPIIFLTGHAEYAKAAFEACAIDYVIKPFTKVDILKSVDKFYIIKSVFVDSQEQRLEEFANNYIQYSSVPKRIFISNVQILHVLHLTDLISIIADGSYTKFLKQDGSQHFSSKILKTYDEILKNHPDFVRIHRSSIINKNFVKAVIRDKKGLTLIQMIDGQLLEISPQRKDEILNKLL